MVSIGARNADGPNGITNFNLIGNGSMANNIDGLKIILIVDNQTQKVKNIELFETMQDMKQVNNRYPKSSFYAGVLNGKYAVRMKILVDIEKPDWNNMVSNGNYSIEPAKGSVISLNTKEPFVPGGEFLPLKGAKSFLANQDIQQGEQFLSGDKFKSGGDFRQGDQFNFGTVNSTIVENKDGIVVFKAVSNNPMGFEPLETPTGEIITPTISNEPFEPIDATTVLQPIRPTIGTEPFEPIDATTLGQPIKTEIEFPNVLKVSVTDLLCIEERDSGDNPDDYGFQLFSYFKDSNGKYDWDFKLNNNIDCNRVVPPANLLVCGDKAHQIHVEKGSARIGNFNHTSIYYVLENGHYTMAEIEDLRFFIWLKEYTKNDDQELFNGSINIKVVEVLNHLLQGKFPDDSNLIQFYDTSITTLNDFYEYGPRGSYMWLRFTSRKTLEGPIRLGNNFGKAAVWIEFELMNQ
jgi:hypothetical protein